MALLKRAVQGITDVGSYFNYGIIVISVVEEKKEGKEERKGRNVKNVPTTLS